MDNVLLVCDLDELLSITIERTHQGVAVKLTSHHPIAFIPALIAASSSPPPSVFHILYTLS